jgi:hypothetical protein
MTLVSVATADEKATCHESSRYMIVEGDTGGVGTNFLVKYKRQKSEPPVCKYAVNPVILKSQMKRAKMAII